MKHKHCDLIKAWADGVEIQQKHPIAPTKWEEISKYPSWSDGMEYRIKPKTIKYRLFLNEYNQLQLAYPNEPTGYLVVKYLTDWQEVEV